MTFVARNRDLNRLVMDYLVIEGYKDAADCFSKESGLKPFVDSDSILTRMIIRGAIQRGDIGDAIGRVNELDPEVSFMPIQPALTSVSSNNQTITVIPGVCPPCRSTGPTNRNHLE